MTVLVMICVMGQPCTPSTARAYAAIQAPPGFTICGTPGALPIGNAALQAGVGEAMHVRCKMGERND